MSSEPAIQQALQRHGGSNRSVPKQKESAQTPAPKEPQDSWLKTRDYPPVQPAANQ